MFPGPHGTVEEPKPTKCYGCKMDFMDPCRVPVPHDLIIAHRQKYLYWNGKTQSKKDIDRNEKVNRKTNTKCIDNKGVENKTRFIPGLVPAF